MRWKQWLLDASAPRSVILIRFLVGGVFFSEGVQKFLFPAALGWDVFRGRELEE
jgi:putative oxidoreductase